MYISQVGNDKDEINLHCCRHLFHLRVSPEVRVHAAPVRGVRLQVPVATRVRQRGREAVRHQGVLCHVGPLLAGRLLGKDGLIILAIE